MYKQMLNVTELIYVAPSLYDLQPTTYIIYFRSEKFSYNSLQVHVTVINKKLLAVINNLRSIKSDCILC